MKNLFILLLVMAGFSTNAQSPTSGRNKNIDCQAANSNYKPNKAVQQWDTDDRNTAIWLLNKYYSNIVAINYYPNESLKLLLDTFVCKQTQVAPVTPATAPQTASQPAAAQKVDCQSLNSYYRPIAWQDWTTGDRNTAIWLLNNQLPTKYSVEYLTKVNNQGLKALIDDLCKAVPANVDCHALNSNYQPKALENWTTQDRNAAIWLLNNSHPTKYSMEYLALMKNQQLKILLYDVCEAERTYQSAASSQTVSQPAASPQTVSQPAPGQKIDCHALNSNYHTKVWYEWNTNDRNTAIWLLNNQYPEWSVYHLNMRTDRELKAMIDDLCKIDYKVLNLIDCHALNSNYQPKAVHNWTTDDRNTAIWLLNNQFPTQYSVEYLTKMNNIDLKELIKELCK